jgi:hypothetical protein
MRKSKIKKVYLILLFLTILLGCFEGETGDKKDLNAWRTACGE